MNKLEKFVAWVDPKSVTAIRRVQLKGLKEQWNFAMIRCGTWSTRSLLWRLLSRLTWRWVRSRLHRAVRLARSSRVTSAFHLSHSAVASICPDTMPRNLDCPTDRTWCILIFVGRIAGQQDFLVISTTWHIRHHLSPVLLTYIGCACHLLNVFTYAIHVALYACIDIWTIFYSDFSMMNMEARSGVVKTAGSGKSPAARKSEGNFP